MKRFYKESRGGRLSRTWRANKKKVGTGFRLFQHRLKEGFYAFREAEAIHLCVEGSLPF
jgi:hypothetical protein